MSNWEDLKAAGFTPEELQQFADALSFAVTIAGGMDQSTRLTLPEGWSAEKVAALWRILDKP